MNFRVEIASVPSSLWWVDVGLHPSNPQCSHELTGFNLKQEQVLCSVPGVITQANEHMKVHGPYYGGTFLCHMCVEKIKSP